MILRDARPDDAPILASLDLGHERAVWLDEVREILDGLIGWRDDVASETFDRQVQVAEDGSGIIAACAHERLEHGTAGPVAEHRYLMVVAVRDDHRRSGIGRVLMESVLAAIQADGVRSVRWLVHAGNVASIAFSRAAFPDADETYPPEDRPYMSFVLEL